MQIFLLKSRPCKVVSRGIKTVSFASTSFAKLKKHIFKWDAFTNKIIAKVNGENLLNDKSEINFGLKA